MKRPWVFSVEVLPGWDCRRWVRGWERRFCHSLVILSWTAGWNVWLGVGVLLGGPAPAAGRVLFRQCQPRWAFALPCENCWGQFPHRVSPPQEGKPESPLGVFGVASVCPTGYRRFPWCVWRGLWEIYSLFSHSRRTTAGGVGFAVVLFGGLRQISRRFYSRSGRLTFWSSGTNSSTIVSSYHRASSGQWCRCISTSCPV